MKLAACNPENTSVFARACLEACRESGEVTGTLPVDWISVGFVSPRNFSILLASRATRVSSEAESDDDWVNGFMVQLSKDGERAYLILRSSSLLVSEASGILLPPQTLQKLGIFRHRLSDGCAADAANISIEVKEASITPKMIGTLNLINLVKNEVDEEREKVAMELYFSIPRYLADGDIICLPTKASNTKHGCDDSEVEEIAYRWYLVGSKGGRDVDVTSPVHTKITMSGATSSAHRHLLLPDIDCTTKLACMELAYRRNQSPNEYSKMVSGVRLWSQYVTGVPYHFHDDGSADVHSLFNSSHTAHATTKAPTDCSLAPSTTAVLRHLSPALELARLSQQGTGGAVYGALSSSPLLVECRKGVKRRRQLLLSCAGVLGVHLYTLDARFLWQYSGEGGKFDSAASVLGPVGERWSSPDEDDSLHGYISSYGSSSSALEAVKRAPCLLYIEGTDEVLADVRGLRTGADAPSPEAMFAESVRRFLSDVQRLRQATEGSGDSRSDLVLPVAVVESREALGQEVRELFEREVDITASRGGSAAATATIGSSSTTGGTGASALDRERDREVAAKAVRREVASFLGAEEGSLALPVSLAAGAWEDDPEAEDSLSHSNSGAGGNKLTANVSPVYWSDIGGLDVVRQEILDIIQLPLQRPDLFPPGCPRRRAALLYGAPGTGKTLVAKAVATECGMSFLSIKGPELLDMYVGESERNIRQVFANARKHTPCVLFFDELDSLAPARGRSGDGGGVMDRVVAQLLTEMDSLSSSSASASSSASQRQAPGTGEGEVFVLGATNRPDLLDPALLRPGRFDRKIYLSVCSDPTTRENILQAQTRKLTLGCGFTLREVSDLLPDTLTGADIGALVSSAFTSAQQRTLHSLRSELELQVREERDREEKDEGWIEKEVAARLNRLPSKRLRVVVEREDLLAAAETLVPSVSAQELQHYERLAQEYNDLASS